MTTAVPTTNPTSVKMISIFGSSGTQNNKLSVDSQKYTCIEASPVCCLEARTTRGPWDLDVYAAHHTRDMTRTSCEGTDARSHLPADDALLREEEETPDAG